MDNPDKPWEKHLLPDITSKRAGLPSPADIARLKEHEKKETAQLAMELAEEDVKAVLREDQGQGLLWPRPVHVQSNLLLTSAIFRAMRRSVAVDAVVATQGPVSFSLKGFSLTQFDELVWMDLVQTMREQKSVVVGFSLSGIVRSLGLAHGGSNIQRVKNSVERMGALWIKVEVSDDERPAGYAGALLGPMEWKGDCYRLKINPVWARMLFREGYTRVDWATHTALPVGFATWLHRYIARHTATKRSPHRIGIATLCALLGTSMTLKSGRFSIRKAMGAIASLNGVAGWSIDHNDNLVFWRPLSKKQKHEAVLKKLGAKSSKKEKSPERRIKEQMPNSGQRNLFEF